MICAVSYAIYTIYYHIRLIRKRVREFSCRGEKGEEKKRDIKSHNLVAYWWLHDLRSHSPISVSLAWDKWVSCQRPTQRLVFRNESSCRVSRVASNSIISGQWRQVIIAPSRHTCPYVAPYSDIRPSLLYGSFSQSTDVMVGTTNFRKLHCCRCSPQQLMRLASSQCLRKEMLKASLVHLLC